MGVQLSMPGPLLFLICTIDLWALVNMVMEPSGSIKGREFLN
jgi:hypothetical protein